MKGVFFPGWEVGGGACLWSDGELCVCSRQQLSVPEFHLSCHCFVITASALALSEGVASSAASECVFSVARAGHVQSKNKEDFFFFFFCNSAATLLFFSNSALLIRSSLLVAIRGCDRLTPIMQLSKKSALLTRPNTIIKKNYQQIPCFKNGPNC